MADFAERLKSLRIKKGISQQELADVINVNKQTISGYERGIRRPAGENAREIYEQLADYFNVDTTFLMGLSDVTVTLSNPLNSNIPDDSDFDLLTSAYISLNDDGKKKLLDYANDLVSSGNYKKEESSQTFPA